jgi:hypothetical protein
MAAADPQQLERDILHTREQLGEDVDALVQRVDPRRVAARKAYRAREMVRSHPGATALLGLSAAAFTTAWVIWRRR